MQSGGTDNHWLEASINSLGRDDRDEFLRRVESIQQLLVGLLFSSRAENISASQLLGHLTLLVQQPLLMFLYEIGENPSPNGSTPNNSTGDAWKYLKLVHYYNYEKTIVARGSSLETLQFRTKSESYSAASIYRQMKADSRKQMFPIFIRQDGTLKQYFLRVYRMDETTTDDSKFHEVENPFNGIEAIEIKTIDQYIAACTAKLFSFSSKVQGKASFESFERNITGKVTAIVNAVLSQQRWGKNSTRTATIEMLEDEDKAAIESCATDFFKSLCTRDSDFDRLYRRVRRPTELVKSFTARDDSKPGAPNIFFALRSYDRKLPRMVAEDFPGFNHNLRFVLSDEQKRDIQAALLADDLSKHDETFKTVEPKEDGYNTLRRELDDWYWGEHAKGVAAYDDGKGNLDTPFKSLFDIFESPIGAETLSFLEPVFYAGVPAYRYPYRRLGGLQRIRPVKESFERFKATEEAKKRSFVLADVTEANTAVLEDIHRLVVSYYFLRLLGPGISDRKNQWTTLLLFPVEVCGSIAAVVGTVLYRPIQQEHLHDVFGRDATQRWNAALHFYREIFLPTARDLRRMYRDSQIRRLYKEVFGITVKTYRLILTSTPYNNALRAQQDALFSGPDNFKALYKNYVDAIEQAKTKTNKYMAALQRFNPYPLIEISWEKKKDVTQLSPWQRAISDAYSPRTLVIQAVANEAFSHDFVGHRLRRADDQNTPPESSEDEKKMSAQENADLELIANRLTAAMKLALRSQEIQETGEHFLRKDQMPLTVYKTTVQ